LPGTAIRQVGGSNHLLRAFHLICQGDLGVGLIENELTEISKHHSTCKEVHFEGDVQTTPQSVGVRNHCLGNRNKTFCFDSINTWLKIVYRKENLLVASHP